MTQNPLDLPDAVLGQLGNRVLHALRAFTPSEQRVVRAVAQTFRQNPDLDPEQAIPELRVGEALVSHARRTRRTQQSGARADPAAGKCAGYA